MSRIFWLAPAAIICSYSTCFATEYLTISQAQALCFPQATKFLESKLTYTPEQLAAIEQDSGIRVRFQDQLLWKAFDAKNNFLGWFIQDRVVGKHDFIDWVLALTPDGKVKQIEILTYRETYGSEVRRDTWKSQFYGKAHGAAFKLDKDIKNISGSTLSCRHLADGVKRLLSSYELVFNS